MNDNQKNNLDEITPEFKKMFEALGMKIPTTIDFHEVTGKQKGGGLRHNAGKVRHDLLPTWAINEVAKVFTKGAEKYADRNWEKGMAWSKVLASLKRHLAALEMGEDFDIESGCYHAAHVATNAMFILQYYKIFPQGDDRPHQYLLRPKIGLDIDEVLCDWVGGWQKYHRLNQTPPTAWNMSYATPDLYKSMTPDQVIEFYSSLEPKMKPEDIPFEPHCYITSRFVSKEITEKWLEQHGFPCAPVYTIGHGVSKVDVAKQSGIEMYVDDRYENFVELNNAGICTFLWDAPHNRRYEVGYKRITSLKSLV